MASIVSAGTTSSTALNMSADTTGILQLASNNGTVAVTVDTSQNVGIGTASPAANLDVQAATGPQVRIKPVTGTSYGFLSIGNTGGNFNIGRESSGGGSLLTGSTGYASVLNSFGAYPMQFGTNGAVAMTLDSSGNFFVGKTTYSDTSGNGFGVFPNSGVPQVSCVGASNSTNKNFTVYSATDSAYKFYVDYAGGGYYAGDLLVGTTSTVSGARVVIKKSNGERIIQVENTRNVSGDQTYRSVLGTNCNDTSSYHFIATTGGADKYYLYGNGTYGTISDQRLKKNIETARDGYLEDLARLRVVKYNWTEDAENAPKELGWIAQEVEQVFAGLVQDGLPNEDGDTYKQVKTSVLPFMLLKAIQELKAINDTQAETINALTARIVALEAK